MWWPETVYREPQPGQAPLARYGVFRSNDLEAAREFVGSVFCPHRLTPKLAEANREWSPDIAMNHVPVADLSVNYLRYGVPVVIEPGELASFFLVQVQLDGLIEARSGRQTADIAPGHASVLSPSEYTSMVWSADSTQVLVRLGRDAVERQLAVLLGRHLPHPLVFNLDMDCTAGPSGAWWRAIRFLVSELDYSGNVMNSPLGARQFQESLICSLLYGQPHNYTEAMQRGLSGAAPRHVKLAEDYIESHADEPVTIEDLAGISEVSARTLFAGFKEFRGTSPMRYLREVRLRRVRGDLMAASPGQTVTEVATKWGFFQLGRFAVEYRRAFGESPSDTLKGALN